MTRPQVSSAFYVRPTVAADGSPIVFDVAHSTPSGGGRYPSALWGLNVGPGTRDRLFYFDAGGGLNAIRMDHEGHAWKITFTEMSGDLPTAWHKTPSWPLITDLRQDPYEYFNRETAMTFGKWWADRMYLMVPAQEVVGAHLKSLEEFPPARGSSLSLGKIMEQIQYAKPGQ